MAITKIADVIVPELFNRYRLQSTNFAKKFPGFFSFFGVTIFHSFKDFLIISRL